MSLKELSLNQSYSSDMGDNPLYDFYIPVLKESTEYNRIAGYFCSTSLAVAAKGILGLIENGGTMNLIVSPKLTKEDIEVMSKSLKDPTHFISNKLIYELENMEQAFEKDHIFALGWMIANKKLKIKIALVYDEFGNQLDSKEINKLGIFHQKIGYFKDEFGNLLSFSGSINETCNGWLNNIEEFKVFRGWEQVENTYCDGDIRKFKSFWNNTNPTVKTVDIPEAVVNKFIELAPRDLSEIKALESFRIKKENSIVLFEYQKTAMKNWVKNDYSGIFEMATGTGKTFTALACLNLINKQFKQIVTVIACPQNTLMLQWKKEVDRFGIKYDKHIIADCTNSKWKSEFADSLMDIILNNLDKVVVFTTHDTLGSKNFIEILRKYKRLTPLMLIADEVHGLGSIKRRVGLIEDYNFRLGLSATPKRWGDEIGTSKLYQYFKDVVFEFTLKDALTTVNPLTGKTYLVKYKYKPIFVSLTNDELENYIDKTKKIISMLERSKNDQMYEEILEKLIFQRANIHKNAVEKYEALKDILLDLEKPIHNTIIFVSAEQIDRVMCIVKSMGLIAHRFTQSEGTYPSAKYGGLSEREYIIANFKEKKYQLLVAIKCLDEGIDIPTADTAILLASSTNPREYVQRIGRVIRQAKFKNEAIIYDIIVKPSITNVDPTLKNIELSIYERELQRAEEIAMNASNNAVALNLLYKNKY